MAYSEELSLWFVLLFFRRCEMMVNLKTLCNVTKVFWATNPVQEMFNILKMTGRQTVLSVCISCPCISVCPIILHLVYERERETMCVHVLVLVYVIVCECDVCVMAQMDRL